MKLSSFQVTSFRSIRDSGECEIDDVTCLVGKNEAGKTALLKALYRLNPLIPEDQKFDEVEDYPRSELADYQEKIEGGQSHTTVIRATFSLSDADLTETTQLFGKDIIAENAVTLSMGYGNRRNFAMQVDEAKALKHYLAKIAVTEELRRMLQAADTSAAMADLIESQEQTPELKQIAAILREIADKGMPFYIYNTLLQPKLPKFLYFDEYYQMRGHVNIEALIKRQTNNKLQQSDHPMIGLIELARLKLEDLLNPSRAAELRSRLEGAGNSLTSKALNYWSQNKHIEMRFDVQPARAEDPEDMRTGTNLWALVYDTRHRVTTELGSRSRGFVWFFSFLAWYSKIKREHGPIILLLDEPGLFLHGKAQEDLLRYFETELKPSHQLLYSTHSPFMVDPKRFDRVRIVEDRGIDSDDPQKQKEGTRVTTDAFTASSDSLFPLQNALGYEIYQTLFVGPNCLLVEGVSDLLYLESISDILRGLGKEGLRKEWTIIPVGGGGKIATFAALMRSQKGLKIGVLVDISSKDQQQVEDLYKQKLLNKANVHTFGEFTGQKEADIEDMFGEDFYLGLVNAEFKTALNKEIKAADLPKTDERLLYRVEAAFQKRTSKAAFSHYRPARYFAHNSADLASNLPVECLERFEKAFVVLNDLL